MSARKCNRELALTRALITRAHPNAIADDPGAMRLRTEEELKVGLDHALKEHSAGDELWLFAYLPATASRLITALAGRQQGRGHHDATRCPCTRDALVCNATHELCFSLTSRNRRLVAFAHEQTPPASYVERHGPTHPAGQ
jgi:hypothetical protein